MVWKPGFRFVFFLIKLRGAQKEFKPGKMKSGKNKYHFWENRKEKSPDNNRYC